MATSAPRFCAKPGCGNFASGGKYCEVHKPEMEAQRIEKKRAYQRTRPTTTEQGYGAKWRKVRNAYLRAQPLCEECAKEHKVELAVLVHHRKAVKDGGDKYNWDNLQSLCNACHEKIEGPRRWERKKPRGGANP